MIDQGSFGATSVRNGTQYFARIDQGFKSDRIYVSLFRTLLLTGAPSLHAAILCVKQHLAGRGASNMDAHVFAQHPE